MARIGNPWKLQLWVDDPVKAFIRMDLDSRVSILELSRVLADWCSQNMGTVVTSSCEEHQKDDEILKMTLVIKSTSTPLDCNGTVESTKLFQHQIDRDLSVLIGDDEKSSTTKTSTTTEMTKEEHKKRPHIDIRYTLDAPGIIYVVALRMGSSLDYLRESCFDRGVPRYLQQTMWESRRNPAITEKGKNLTAFDRPRCVASPDALSVVHATSEDQDNVVASMRVHVEEALVPQTLILQSDRIEYGDVYDLYVTTSPSEYDSNIYSHVSPRLRVMTECPAHASTACVRESGWQTKWRRPKFRPYGVAVVNESISLDDDGDDDEEEEEEEDCDVMCHFDSLSPEQRCDLMQRKRIRASRVMDVLGRAGLLDLDKDEKERLKNQEEQAKAVVDHLRKYTSKRRTEMSKREKALKKKMETKHKWWLETQRRDVEEFEELENEMLRQDNITAYETRILRDDLSAELESMKKQESYSELRNRVEMEAEIEMNRTRREVDAEMTLLSSQLESQREELARLRALAEENERANMRSDFVVNAAQIESERLEMEKMRLEEEKMRLEKEEDNEDEIEVEVKKEEKVEDVVKEEEVVEEEEVMEEEEVVNEEDEEEVVKEEEVVEEEDEEEIEEEIEEAENEEENVVEVDEEKEEEEEAEEDTEKKKGIQPKIEVNEDNEDEIYFRAKSLIDEMMRRERNDSENYDYINREIEKFQEEELRLQRERESIREVIEMMYKRHVRTLNVELSKQVNEIRGIENEFFDVLYDSELIRSKSLIVQEFWRRVRVAESKRRREIESRHSILRQIEDTSRYIEEETRILEMKKNDSNEAKSKRVRRYV